MMSKILSGMLAIALLGLFSVPRAMAEDAHHPQAGAQSAQSSPQSPPAAPAVPQGQPAPGAMPGGMGMMGQPGASQPGAASGGMMPMMGMMGQGGMGMGQGGMMGMMEMMGQGGMMGAVSSGMPGMVSHTSMMIDRVEGRIAFLRAELKVTDAQAKTWAQFADALRANGKKLGELRAAMMQGGAAPTALIDRLDQQERWLEARLDGARAIKTTFKGLYATLSDEQKKTADELVAPHVGMMPMAMM